MADKASNSERRGVIICQDGELDLEDPAIEEGFADLKASIMTGRTDILRILLSAAQNYRDEEEMFDDDDEFDEDGNKRVTADEQEILDLLQMLLNFRDNDAGTGLHYATKLDRNDMVRSLLAAGANPTLKNLEGATPYDYCHSNQAKNAYVGALMQAVAQSKPYRVNLLLKAGVDVNAGDGADSDNKVLHWAASFADVTIVELLLEAGANVNALNSDGSTALHDAIVRGDQEIILELLKHGARVDIIPFKGPMERKSCYDIAAGKEDILTLLEVHLLTSESQHNRSQSNENEDKKEDIAVEAPTSPSDISSFSLVVPTDDSSPISEKETLIEDADSIHKQKPFKPILLPPKSPMRLFLPTTTQLDPGVLQLWPPPKKILQYKGSFYVPPINLNFIMMAARNTTAVQLTEFTKLIHVMQPKLQRLGFNVHTEMASSYSASSSVPKGSIECFLDSSTICDEEEYKLHTSTKKVKIIAGGIKSIFYALNTFIQCLRIFQGKGLPLLQISDSPETRMRGVQFDFCEGDLPKLENFLQYIDILSSFKINQIFLPIELFLQDDQRRFRYYNRSDLLQLHNYCQERFIELVPALRCTDVLDPVNAKSYACIKSEMLPLFPDSRFLSISLDDSENLSKGNQNLLSGITDNDLVRRIEELHEFCVSNGLTLLLDSDIILQQPVKLMDISHNLICFNVLREGKEEAITDYLTDLGVSHLVSSSYEDKRTMINDVRLCLKCFENSHRTRKQRESLGIVLRSALKANSLCCTTIEMVSLAISSAMSWRFSPATVSDEELMSGIINRHIYEDDNDVVGNLIMTLSSIEQISLISKPQGVSSSVDGSWQAESTDFGQLKALLNATDNLAANSLSFESLKITSISLKQLEGAIGKCKIRSRLKEMLLAELTSILKILSFLCRVGLALQKPKTAEGEITLSDLSQIQRSDLSNKLMNLLEPYEMYCTTYYKETPEGLKSVAILKNLLKRLHPETESSFLNSLVRTFTV